MPLSNNRCGLINKRYRNQENSRVLTAMICSTQKGTGFSRYNKKASPHISPVIKTTIVVNIHLVCMPDYLIGCISYFSNRLYSACRVRPRAVAIREWLLPYRLMAFRIMFFPLTLMITANLFRLFAGAEVFRCTGF